MQIAFLIYEGLTALDIIGPYETLRRIPDADVRFLAKKPGEVRVDSGAFAFRTDHGISDVPHPDVFVVPGGAKGTFAAAQDDEILAWVREAHAHSVFSTSVCTGSLILGAAGLLKGLRATTHWAAAPLLAEHGAIYTAVQRSGRRRVPLTSPGRPTPVGAPSPKSRRFWYWTAGLMACAAFATPTFEEI